VFDLIPAADMWEAAVKGFKALAAGNAQAKLGTQSPHLPGAMVRIGRFLYSVSLGWIGIVWYTGYANMRTQPGSGPTLVLPGKPIIAPPDRPGRQLPLGMTPGSGGGKGGGNGSGPTTGALANLKPLTSNTQAYPGSPGRTDQGVDFGATGAVRALGNGKIRSVGLWNGWPGSGGLVYDIPGYPPIYVMEHFAPAPGLKAGDRITKGQVIGTALGGSTGIETGFANAQGTAPMTPYSGSPDGTPMPGGLAFRKLLGYS
jgi:hypothetical protein